MKCPVPIVSQARTPRRGIALVITLLMLSVVTITAVAFLAVSRRERTAVATASSQVDARYMADIGVQHAQGRVSGRIAASTNRAAFGGYFVSTNYGNPYFRLGPNSAFLSTADYHQLTNVTYFRDTNFNRFNLSTVADRDEYARMLGNLYYDPRPPVFVQTNRDPRFPQDFRYYLDLNRNGQFETNGLIVERDRQGRVISRDPRFYWGDPEWIGVLENPDVPHSGTNRFVGRFAYVVVPTSHALDLNYIGNNAKRINVDQGLPNQAIGLLDSGYLRNQGVGTWEFNLAAFFGALNTNVWGFSVNDYLYRTNLTQANSGIAFSDAERLRRFRQQTARPVSADAFYEVDSGNTSVTQVQNTFRRDFVDAYSDGPLVVTLSDIRSRYENDEPNLSWSGSDLTNQFTEINDLFNPQLGLTARITGQYTNQGVARTSPLSTYDRYTFYRLLSQLGTDSGDGRFETGVHPAYSDSYRGRDAVNPFGFYRRAKLNLNYAPDDPYGGEISAARVASFRPWGSLEWFTNATHRMLLSEFTNGLPFFPPNVARSVPGLAIHGWTRARDLNGLEYPTNHIYDARIHRVLQLAANIRDATTNEFLDPISQRVAPPSVYRPLVYEDRRAPGILRIHSFEEVLNGRPNFLLAREWVSPDLVTNGSPRGMSSPSQRLNLSLPESSPPVTSREAGFNIFGLPWVVGAKKGLPNFNQALWQTVIQPTRRLIVTRPSTRSKLQQTELPFSGANSAGFRTEYQYIINVTNIVGVESWNSYLTNFPRPVRIFATNVLEFALVDETPGGPATTVLQRRELLWTNYVKSAPWNARQYESTGFQRDTTSPAYLELPVGVTNRVSTVDGNRGIAIGTGFIYDPVNRRAFSLGLTNQGRVVISQGNRRYLTPVLSAYVTNSLLYAITDEQSGRLLDIVTLRSTMVRTNIISTLGLDPGGLEQQFFNAQAGATGNAGTLMPAFWNTNIVQNNRTRGIDNQMLASIGDIDVPINLWRNPIGAPVREDQKRDTISGMLYFLYGIEPAGGLGASIRAEYGSNLVAQVGFNPSPRVYLSERRMANDPLVHYTKDDLAPGQVFMTEAEYTEIPGVGRSVQLATNSIGFDLGRPSKFINPYAPWGTNGNLIGIQAQAGGSGSTAFNYGFKDPMVRSSDDWAFPIGTNTLFRFAGIGQLGRVHRGTPWQTVYLKSLVAPESGEPPLLNRINNGDLTWGGWAGNIMTHPTNDWKYMDLFTTAINDNAARSQMGVGQAGLAAWAALLSGVPLLENTSSANRDNPRPLFLRPDAPEITQMLVGYQRSGVQVPGLVQVLGWTTDGTTLVNRDGVFPSLGSILQVPTFSDRAPFIDTGAMSAARNITDEVLERVPQQVLSLLRADEPRFVIYSFGQTLRPAQNAVNLRPGPYYGIVTNYNITGEYVTKTVLRLDGDPRRLQPIIEDQRVILSNP